MRNETLDDQGGSVRFWPAEQWRHEVVASSISKVCNDTLSLSLEGGYNFDFNGTGFGLCSGLGRTEGSFEVYMCALFKHARLFSC